MDTNLIIACLVFGAGLIFLMYAGRRMLRNPEMTARRFAGLFSLMMGVVMFLLALVLGGINLVMVFVGGTMWLVSLLVGFPLCWWVYKPLRARIFPEIG
jgi:hypothetical protein